MNPLPRKPISSKPPRRRSASSANDAERVRQWIAQGRDYDAVAWARQQLKGDVDDDTFLLAARVLQQTGHVNDAAEAYERFIASGEAAPECWMNLGICHVLSGRDDDAWSAFGRALEEVDRNKGWKDKLVDTSGKLMPPGGELLLSVVHELTQAGKPVAAMDLLERLSPRYESNSTFARDAATVFIEQGRAALALPGLRRLTASAEATATDWYHLGVACEALQMPDAADAYHAALRLDPQHLKSHRNLAVMQIHAGDSKGAMERLMQITALPGDHAQTYFLLGFACRLEDQLHDAVSALRQVYSFDPTHDAARELHGRILVDQQAHDEAIAHYQAWLTQQPNHPVATHMLAALREGDVPTRASSQYVAAAFDQFAETFEQTLRQLKYQVPRHLATILADTLTAEPTRDTLDAGCGTGWLCELLRPYSKTVVGVDLSQRMLDRARRQPYDQLVRADLVAYLQEQPNCFDLLVAADTFNYFGDLQPLLAAAITALRDQGTLIFTLEEGPMTGDTYYLLPHGRYAHAPQYVVQSLGEAGIPGGTIRRVVLRQENGRDVFGLLTAVGKPEALPS